MSLGCLDLVFKTSGIITMCIIQFDKFNNLSIDLQVSDYSQLSDLSLKIN